MIADTNRDFTPAMYRKLLETLQEAGYAFMAFEEFCKNGAGKCVILRHDVDRKPENSLRLAEIEAGMGIRASYHFRVVGSSNNPDIIRKVAGLGHEIGYHYEDLALAAANKRAGGTVSIEGLAADAFDRFRSGLDYFRTFYPVRVISMHGSPTGPVDNRLVWKYFDYHESDVLCEPYFDLDFSGMLYMTDTGRRWDGDRVNIRDRPLPADSILPGEGFCGWKVRPCRGSLLSMTEEGIAFRENYKIHTTKDFLKLAESGKMPERIVINTHPQRWNDAFTPWFWELCAQSFKNQLKKLVIRFRGLKTIN